MAFLEGSGSDNALFLNRLRLGIRFRTSDHLGNHMIRKSEPEKVRSTDLPGEPNVSLLLPVSNDLCSPGQQ